MENQEKSKLAEWLDKIQQDSWQLELVVSAFSIFLTLGALEALKDWATTMQLESEGFGSNVPMLQLAYGVLLGSCLFFLVNLILHVILRGLWISAIGLRSVSGDVDFDALRLSPPFDKLLRRKIGSFDRYVERLENLCSIVFAFTFLIVFMLISFGLWFGLTMLTVEAVDGLTDGFGKYLVGGFYIVYILTSLLYFIDFLTLGFIKRVKWLARFYMPFYRFYSLLTLSALYRPIYYNLVDNKFGRWAAYLLVPYFIVVLTAAGLKLDTHVWYPQRPEQFGIENVFYDDLREEERLVGRASLPSKYTSNGFVELFLRYLPREDDKVLALRCPDLKPLKEAGLTTTIIKSDPKNLEDREKAVAAPSLGCMAGLYTVTVNDSLCRAPKFRFYTRPGQGEKGLLALLDVQHLPRGEHQLLVRKWRKADELFEEAPSDSLLLDTFAIIPFWKE